MPAASAGSGYGSVGGCGAGRRADEGDEEIEREDNKEEECKQQGLIDLLTRRTCKLMFKM